MRTKTSAARRDGERGQALLETAVVLPVILLISVGIFEFGRAYQTMQIVTNAAREGARVAVLANSSAADVQGRVMTYLKSGRLGKSDGATIAVNQNVTMAMGASTATASVVTVNYPFTFMVLNPVANLIAHGT